MVQTRTGIPSSVHHGSGAQASISLRTFAPVLVAIGPAAIAVLRFVLPYNTTDSSRTMADKVIAHPTQESAVIWLSLVAILAMVPAVFWIGRIARNGAPRLGTAALALMIPGYLALGGLLSSDMLLWTGAKVGTSPASLARMYDHLHPAVSVAEAVFVVGHVLGTVLLGLALWRAPSLPRWIAITVVICQPLHFVAAAVVSNHPLDLAAWGLNAVAFAAIAVTAPSRQFDPREPARVDRPHPRRDRGRRSRPRRQCRHPARGLGQLPFPSTSSRSGATCSSA